MICSKSKLASSIEIILLVWCGDQKENAIILIYKGSNWANPAHRDFNILLRFIFVNLHLSNIPKLFLICLENINYESQLSVYITSIIYIIQSSFTPAFIDYFYRGSPRFSR